MKKNPSTLSQLRFCVTAGLLCTTPLLRGQPTPTPAPSGDVQQMVPFEVAAKQTKGGPYVQEEVVSVTKFAVPLIDVPQNIVVFNRALLDDLNTGQLRDALTYNASITGGLYATAGTFRGFSNQEKLNDGFKMSPFFDYDTIHYERVELLKGPSAVMYGRTEPGGITNYVSKKPIPGAHFATFTFGSGKNADNTRKNINFDINDSFGAPGNTPINLRLTGAYRVYQDSRDSQFANGQQKQASIRFAGSYWLTPQTRLYASYAFYERNFDTQFGRYAAFAVTVPGTLAGSAVPFSMVYGRDPFEDYGYGRRFTWQYNDVQVILDHKFSDKLDFRFGFNNHKRWNEDYLLGVAATTLNGQGAIAQTSVNKNKNDADFPDVQAHVVWKPVQDQNILLGVSKNWAYEDVKQWFQQRNPDGTPFRRVYIPAEGIPHALPPDIVYIPTLWTSDPRTYTSLMANYLGGFMQNRLHLMGGISYNKTKTSFAKFDTTKVTINGVLQVPPGFSTTDTTPQFGAIYKITPEFSLFGLYSKSTQFTLTRNSFNQYFGPITGEGGEGGIKFAFKDGRFNGNLTYYSVDQKNNVVFDPLANSLGYAQSVAAGTPNPALLGDNVSTGLTNSNGVELEVNGVITSTWNVSVSFAHNNQTFKKDPQAFRRGTKVPNLEPNKFTILTRYDFSEGDFAKGFFVGGGLIYVDKVYGGFSPGSNNTKTYWVKAGTRIDAFVGYKFTGFGRAQQLRLQVIGLNRPNAFNAGFDPVANDRYYLNAKPIINIDYTVTF